MKLEEYETVPGSHNEITPSIPPKIGAQMKRRYWSALAVGLIMSASAFIVGVGPF
jgi:hypothetical protein